MTDERLNEIHKALSSIRTIAELDGFHAQLVAQGEGGGIVAAHIEKRRRVLQGVK